MPKLAFLKFNGDFEKDFIVTLQISEAGKASSSGWTARLTGECDIAIQYQNWYSIYSSLAKRPRVLRDVEGQSFRFSSIQTCHQAVLQPQEKFNK